MATAKAHPQTETARGNRPARLTLTALLWASLHQLAIVRRKPVLTGGAIPPQTPDRPTVRTVCPRTGPGIAFPSYPLASHPQKTAGRSLRCRTAPARPSRSLASLGQLSPAATSILRRQAAPGHPWPQHAAHPCAAQVAPLIRAETAPRSVFWGGGNSIRPFARAIHAPPLAGPRFFWG